MGSTRLQAACQLSGQGPSVDNHMRDFGQRPARPFRNPGASRDVASAPTMITKRIGANGYLGLTLLRA